MDDELPGMLALQKGVEEQRWPHTVDAQVWAKEWIMAVKANPAIALDESCMIGWFANAIMAGYDTARLTTAEIGIDKNKGLRGSI